MDATLLSTRDSLCLVGPLVVHLANEAIQNSSLVPSAELRQTGYKITILNKEEAAKIPRTGRATTWNKKEIDTLDIYPLGIGGDNNEHIYHLVVVWAAGQRFRRDLGLPPKHFHIALSLEDDPSTDKGIRSLLPEQSKPRSPRLLDHLTYTLHLFSDYELEEKYCVELVKLTPHED